MRAGHIALRRFRVLYSLATIALLAAIVASDYASGDQVSEDELTVEMIVHEPKVFLDSRRSAPTAQIITSARVTNELVASAATPGGAVKLKFAVDTAEGAAASVDSFQVRARRCEADTEIEPASVNATRHRVLPMKHRRAATATKRCRRHWTSSAVLLRPLRSPVAELLCSHPLVTQAACAST